MKKAITIILALALIAALSITAFAAPETYTLTITGAADHTYDIYQIYTGDIAQEGDKTVLSNVKYGQNHYPVNGAIGDAVPANELEQLVNATKPEDILDSAVKGTPMFNDVTPADGETSIVLNDIPAGYYMIVDVSTNLPDGQTKSPIILQVLETTTIASKHAEIWSTKKVDDKNDSTDAEDEINWVDSADYDFGDAVPFQLTVSVPATITAYDSYKLVFHDEQAAGFADPVIGEVYILKADGTKITLGATEYTYHDDCIGGDECDFANCSFCVEIIDVKASYKGAAYEANDVLIVEYTSVLTDAANVGRAGNENGMYVCHPDGHTPADYVTVLTYELSVDKVDGATQAALEGAGFTLMKLVDGEWTAVGAEITGVTTFTWSGIDGGEYKLVETTTPAGYNTIADILFHIDSDHKTEWVKGGNAAFNDLVAKDANGAIVFADAETEGGEEDGKLAGKIENFKGTVLPETGAQGTFLLIGGGALLVLVAAVFMITRKKMSVYED